MHSGDIILIGILALAAIWAIISCVRKKGCSSCPGGCSCGGKCSGCCDSKCHGKTHDA